MSSGSAVVTAFVPASARSLGGSPGADTDCGLHRRHLEDGACAGLVVRGWQIWFPPSAFSRGGVPDLKFDGVSGVLPRSDSFNGKGFTFGELT